MWLALWEMGLVHELPRANDPAYNVSLVERGLLASGDSRPFCERYADRIIAGDLRDPPNGSDAMDAFVLRTHLGTVEVCAVQLARRR